MKSRFDRRNKYATSERQGTVNHERTHCERNPQASVRDPRRAWWDSRLRPRRLAASRTRASGKVQPEQWRGSQEEVRRVLKEISPLRSLLPPSSRNEEKQYARMACGQKASTVAAAVPPLLGREISRRQEWLGMQ